jgi:hypothetical protein
MSANQQRITETLAEYWQAKRNNGRLPDEKDIDPSDLENIWDACFLVRYEEDDKFRYLFMGDDIIEALGDDLTGKEVCHKLVGELHDPLVEKFLPVLDADEPVYDESIFMNKKQMEIRYRMCMVPLLGEQASRANYILGGMKWKAY